MSTEISAGSLYVVATPIGNLGDISQRAIEILNSVDVIAAEDTRHSRILLDHYAISTPMQAFHEHNEQQQVPKLIKRLQQGDSIALITDAGTPLVSDPGYRLVQQAHAQAIQVVPLPGACAAIAALSAAGIATDRFVYEGFVPAKQAARLSSFETLKHETRTMVFYVACHKITDTVEDMETVFGAEREVTLARELTKNFETIIKTTIGELKQRVLDDQDQRKGEIVLVVAGNVDHTEKLPVHTILEILLQELSVKQASKLAARITGRNKNECYKMALALKESEQV